MAEPLYRPAFMVLSRANGGVRMELRKGHRSVRRSFTPEEAQLLMFMLATALADFDQDRAPEIAKQDRKSTRLNSSHLVISYAVFCLEKKKDSQETVLST